MDTQAFDFFSPQQLVFGPGQLRRLPELAAPFGKNLILVTGKTSFLNSGEWASLEKGFAHKRFRVHPVSIPGEPSPEDIDPIARQFGRGKIDLVVAIGGGSVVDAGKAVSAMAGRSGSVTDYLEGVGTLSHSGEKLPFIAVPTTSGTGSEATKNAVISRRGANGFKKSLRHNNFIPDIALVDPGLTLTCSPAVTAACGMDALTQLLEAYVSVQSSPMTDALCISGLKDFGRALKTAVETDPKNLTARTRLSYGAYLSGLALANAGLGTVHGFASVLGGMSMMSHGNVCGTLLAETTKASIDFLKARDPAHPALEKFAHAARVMGLSQTAHPIGKACNRLIDTLFDWTETFKMPRLSAWGVTGAQIDTIAQATGQKNNPAALPGQTLVNILRNRL